MRLDVQTTNWLTRRQFLTGVIGLVFVVLSRVFKKTTPDKTLDLQAPLTSSRFFKQHIGEIPHIATEHWSLWIYGVNGFPQILTYPDILARDSITFPCTLLCAGNPPDGDLIASGEWRGIALYELLGVANLPYREWYLRFDCADGYSTSMELRQLENAILAYEMNAQPLAPEHGFPIRLVVPGLYGYKMPKWIQRITVTEQPHLGFWEALGWSQNGTVPSSLKESQY